MLVLLPGMALGSLLTLFWQQKFRICLMKKGDSEDKPGRDVNGRMECDGRLSASGPIHVPLELEIRSSSCVGEGLPLQCVSRAGVSQLHESGAYICGNKSAGFILHQNPTCSGMLSPIQVPLCKKCCKVKR